MKNQKGFTLIELLLVLAIIGIISAIAIPALMGQRKVARQRGVEGAVATIAAEFVTQAETMRRNGSTPTPATVLAKVQAMPNFSSTVAKNAYFPSEGTYKWTGAPSKDGQVGITTGTASVTITGQYTDATSGTSKTIAKVVSIDQ